MPDQQPFRYQLMNRRPSNSLASREDWANFIDQGIVDLFEREPAARNLVAASPEYEAFFDEYVIFQATTLGWRIYCSQIVLLQMNAWTVGKSGSGPDKLRRLGEAVTHLALILRGQRKLPITDPILYSARQETIEELKLLFAHLGDFAKTQRGRITRSKFTELAATYLEQYKPPYLFNDRENFLDYLKKSESSVGADEDRFAHLEILNDTSQSLSASQFHDAWRAYRWRRDPEKLRQRFSSLGSAKV